MTAAPGSELVFAREEYEARLSGVRGRMAERGVDVLVATDPANVCWLSGYHTTTHQWLTPVVLRGDGEPVLLVWREESARPRTWIDRIESYGLDDDPVALAARLVGNRGAAGERVALDRGGWIFTEADARRFDAALPGARFADAAGLVEDGRRIKSPAEIEVMRHAARAAIAGLEAAIAAVRPGASENDVAAEALAASVRAGGEYTAIPPYITSGPRAALGNVTWQGRRIEQGDIVYLEIGSAVSRYHAALTRCVALDEIDPRLRAIEEAGAEAMAETLAVMRPGVPVGEVDRIRRAAVARSPFGGTPSERTGYAIGIGFAPGWGESRLMSLQASERRPLAAGMTFHVSTFVQIPGEAGIGLTETVVVTESGGEPLTPYPRRLFVAQGS